MLPTVPELPVGVGEVAGEVVTTDEEADEALVLETGATEVALVVVTVDRVVAGAGAGAAVAGTHCE